MAVAAYPDDLEFGAASAVARWTSQEKKVVDQIVTKGEAGINRFEPAKAGPLRVQEEKNSVRMVGAETVESLD